MTRCCFLQEQLICCLLLLIILATGIAYGPCFADKF